MRATRSTALGALGAAAALAAAVASACGGGPDGPSGGTGAGAGADIDWNGSSGSGDALHEGDADAFDPARPKCLPGSLATDGACEPSCLDAGGSYCGGVEGVEGSGDAAACAGAPLIESHDCAVCCDRLASGACDDEACVDPIDDDECTFDDCGYTLTCPDALCDAAAGETCATCPADCPCEIACGDGTCDTARGETCATCPEDCVECVTSGCPDGTCTEDETCATCPDDCGRCAKVMTWNIAAGLKRGPSRVGSTIKAIANAIALERPDFVALQEVDLGTRRSGGIDQALLVAKRVKMWKRFASAYKFDGGYHGLAILSRRPFNGPLEVLELENDGEFDPRRIAAAIDVDAGLAARFAVTQLSGHASAREGQAVDVSHWLGDSTALLGGDLREGPEKPAVQALVDSGLADLWKPADLGDGFTFGSQRTDYVLAGAYWWDFLVDAYTLPARGLSDHRPAIYVFQPAAQGAPVDPPCQSDGDCAAPYARVCASGRCVECNASAQCADADYPSCNALGECQ